MRTTVLWGLLALLCQHTLVSSHILGRASSTSDLAQLKSLLERFEGTLAEAVQQEDSEGDYEETNQVEEDHEPLLADKSQPLAVGPSRAMTQRNNLLDLLMSTRKRASSCFGARMDRIGNASGLGCNNGRG
ncbi:natriuretic peptides A [Echeneis naucrates]|nr:natriuretic peptides A-like [Echeneis naucrates]